MKKVKVILTGADSDYEEVGTRAKGTVWEFKKKAILECVLMSRTQLTSKFDGSPYDMYVVIDFVTKEELIIFCNSVLEDRLKNVPLFSCVKISYVGTEPIKKYNKFTVGFNKKFTFNPNDWKLKDDNYVTPAEQENETTSLTPTTQAGNQELEDAPF